MRTVIHLTSAHQRFDVRIFHKECKSLSTSYSVGLVVADGKGDECVDGIDIYDVGLPNSRFNRFISTTNKVYKKALALDAELYHTHDPELIPQGLRLLRNGKKVIFDAHEDFAKQLISKPYLHPLVARSFSRFFCALEPVLLHRFSAVVAATPYIERKFAPYNSQTISVNNYPMISEFSPRKNFSPCSSQICYVGGLSKVRGTKEIIQAMGEVTGEIKLVIAGVFAEQGFRDQVMELSELHRVNFVGFVDRKEIQRILHSSFAGLVTLHPIINYLDALPVKMFEYMAAGLPVIASDIPLWRKIIDDAECGVCVDPYDPSSIADAINYLAANPLQAAQMGENGLRAIQDKYNWANEESKLIGLYQKILSE